MSEDVNVAVDKLIARMDRDRRWMNIWRRVHTVAAYVIGAASLVLPLLLSTSVLGADVPAPPWILFTIALLGGISTAYQPGVHAMERRQDAFAVEAMVADLRIQLLKAPGDEQRMALLETYSKRFHDGLLQRGSRLVLAGSVSRQGASGSEN